MTFRHFCYEMWLENQEEYGSFQSASEYLKHYRWYLKERYRQVHGKLQPKWKSDLTNLSK